jgi:hypothetical protein
LSTKFFIVQPLRDKLVAKAMSEERSESATQKSKRSYYDPSLSLIVQGTVVGIAIGIARKVIVYFMGEPLWDETPIGLTGFAGMFGGLIVAVTRKIRARGRESGKP